MLSIGVVRSSMAAASYFAKDNYYTQHEEGPSHWFGAGAEKLGLTGEVEAGRFKELLEGRIDAETQLGRIRRWRAPASARLGSDLLRTEECQPGGARRWRRAAGRSARRRGQGGARLAAGERA